MDQWRVHAEALASRLVAVGVVKIEAWRQAFAETPRHLFVPRFIANDPQRGWVAVAEGDEPYDNGVYGDDALVTQLDGDPDSWQTLRRESVYYGGSPTSSSSAPVLMAAMLEALDIQAGHRVLEIGTGTGYNAALLCHRLGDRHVTSIDIDATLVADAADRLAALGHRPRLAAQDAATGVPEGPYDRIEVTVAVPRIPTSWLDQTCAGAIILASLSAGLISDALFRLTVIDGGCAGGRPIDHAGTFMPTRDAGLPHGYELHAALDRRDADKIDSWLDVGVVSAYETGFPSFLSLRMRDLQRFVTDSDTWNWIMAADGSWVHQPTPGLIEQGGPRRLWPEIEKFYRDWEQWGRPDRTRLGLTVAATGRHSFWLDAPDYVVWTDDMTRAG